MEMNRSERAGRKMAQAIDEMANMMYNRNTKSNFYNGLYDELEEVE